MFTEIKITDPKVGEDENTELHVACYNGDLELVKKLCESEKDLNIRNKNGITPVMYAAFKGHQNIVDLLYQSGLDLNESVKSLIQQILDIKKQPSLPFIKEIIFEKPNFSKQELANALDTACRTGDVELVKILINQHCDLNVKNANGETALITAIKRNHEGIIKILLEHDADVNLADSDGDTPLFLAMKQNQMEIMEALVKKGADINFRHPKSYEETYLHKMIGKNNKNVVTFLINHGADLNLVDEYKNTPLHRACIDGNRMMAELLIQGGCDINARDNVGYTPLHLTANYNHSELCDLLLNHQADKTIQNDAGETPMFTALMKGNMDLAIKINGDAEEVKRAEAKRNLYLLLGDKIADSIPLEMQKLFNGGSNAASLSLLTKILKDYTKTFELNGIKTVFLNMIHLFEQAHNNSQLNPSEILNQCKTESVQLLLCGYAGHFIPALIESKDNKIQLTLIDSGPLWSHLPEKDGKSISARSIEIPVEHFEKVIYLLRKAKYAPSDEALKIYLENIPDITGNSFVTDESSSVQPYKKPSCHISNLKRVIRYLILHSDINPLLSEKERISKYKLLTFFMRGWGISQAEIALKHDKDILAKSHEAISHIANKLR